MVRMGAKKSRQKREHIKTGEARVFLHSGKKSKRLHIGIILTKAQEERLYALLCKRFGK
jgi:hypothetical protein